VIRPVDSSPEPEPEPRRRTAASTSAGDAFVTLHRAAMGRGEAARARGAAAAGTSSARASAAASTPSGSSATTGSDSTSPSSSAGRTPQRDARVPAGESWRPVSGTNDYAEIVAGPRSGQYVNLSGNARDGMAFSIEFREGKRFHVYGSGAERDEVQVPPTPQPTAGSRRAKAPTAPEGETWAAVSGRADYADILSGPRNGHYVNLSGNAREGREFLIIRRDGHTYHVYGSGDDKQVVEVRRRSA
jgi:hypothetical protein